MEQIPQRKKKQKAYQGVEKSVFSKGLLGGSSGYSTILDDRWNPDLVSANWL